MSFRSRLFGSILKANPSRGLVTATASALSLLVLSKLRYKTQMVSTYTFGSQFDGTGSSRKYLP